MNWKKLFKSIFRKRVDYRKLYWEQLYLIEILKNRCMRYFESESNLKLENSDLRNKLDFISYTTCLDYSKDKIKLDLNDCTVGDARDYSANGLLWSSIRLNFNGLKMGHAESLIYYLEAKAMDYFESMGYGYNTLIDRTSVLITKNS